MRPFEPEKSGKPEKEFVVADENIRRKELMQSFIGQDCRSSFKSSAGAVIVIENSIVTFSELGLADHPQDVEDAIL